MAGKQEEGTGKHPHKSAAEPEPHHEAPTTKGKAESKSSGSEHSGKSGGSESKGSESKGSESKSGGEGTGKHKHKSAAEPFEHHGK